MASEMFRMTRPGAYLSEMTKVDRGEWRVRKHPLEVGDLMQRCDPDATGWAYAHELWSARGFTGTLYPEDAVNWLETVDD